MSKSLSVIIISYNSENFIEKCIKSVLKYLPKNGEVVILDNASTDNTIKRLKKFSKRITLIQSDKNLGFAKGNNVAAKKANGEYLFLLNPDTYLEIDVFSPLLDFMEQNKDAGIVAPKLVIPDGQTQPSVKNLPTLMKAFKEYIMGIKYSYSEYVPQVDQPVEVGMVYGAAMLIKRELFEKLKGFDEKFFMYYEDADLCKRVRELNKKIYYYPTAFVNHLVGGAKTDRDRYKLNYDSFIKYHGPIGAFLLNLIFQIPRIKRHI